MHPHHCLLTFLLVACATFFQGCASGPSVSPVHSHGDGGIEVEVLEQSGKSWNGASLPAYPEAAPQISVVKVTIPPQTDLPWHLHPCINAGYLIAGELLVTAEDGQTRRLEAGDALIELVDTWHYGRNIGDETVEIVVVYVGTEDLPLSVLKAEE